MMELAPASVYEFFKLYLLVNFSWFFTSVYGCKKVVIELELD